MVCDLIKDGQKSLKRT